MSPQLVQKLMSEVPEMREFVDFLRASAADLRDIQYLSFFNDPTELAIEAKARVRAIQIINDILNPLLNTDTHSTEKKPEDSFAV